MPDTCGAHPGSRIATRPGRAGPSGRRAAPVRTRSRSPDSTHTGCRSLPRTMTCNIALPDTISRVRHQSGSANRHSRPASSNGTNESRPTAPSDQREQEPGRLRPEVGRWAPLPPGPRPADPHQRHDRQQGGRDGGLHGEVVEFATVGRLVLPRPDPDDERQHVGDRDEDEQHDHTGAELGSGGGTGLGRRCHHWTSWLFPLPGRLWTGPRRRRRNFPGTPSAARSTPGPSLPRRRGCRRLAAPRRRVRSPDADIGVGAGARQPAAVRGEHESG